MLELRLAWRNIWRHSRRTWLTVAAMVFCNVLLIFLIALQLGNYQMMIDNTLQAFSGHIQVQKAGYQDEPSLRKSFHNVTTLAQDLRENINDVEVSSRALGFALLSSEERSYGVQIVGVEPQFEAAVSTLPGLVVEGRYLADGDSSSSNVADGIVIGEVLARNLRVSVGDEVTLLGSGRDGSMAADVVSVTGIYDSGMVDLDRAIAHINLKHFQSLFSMPEQGHAVVVKAHNFNQVEQIYSQISQLVINNDFFSTQALAVQDWNAMHPGLKQAIQADMGSALFMYAILIILVAFSVMNTQLMSVLERTREFGVIMSLGLRAGRLTKLVLLETSLMAGIGFILGVAGGLAVVGYLSVEGFSIAGMDKMAERFNMSPVMYPQLSFLSILSGPSVIYLGSLIAAIYPAFRLHFLQPVAAMRAA
ncbi:ABC transporter permease [Aurantivibrio plasticivorans]